MSPADARRLVRLCALCVVLACAAPATAGIEELARCQKRIAQAGAKYAQKVIKATLDCTIRVATCQIECESGVYGPPCDPAPPPCCDPNDRNSNATFGACMTAADEFCAHQTEKIATAEAKKQLSINSACALVTQEELCGTQSLGLNFDTLNAGCLALDPTYTCTLANLLNCVAGPLERQLADKISTLLHPRAANAITALGLQGDFPDIPTIRKVTGTVAEGKADVWAFTGQAGDEVIVRVNTRDDTGFGVSSVHPALVLVQSDYSPIPDTTVRTITCGVPTVCGAGCPQLKRTLPFSGTYHAAIGALTGDSCGGGGYKLIVTSKSPAPPILVQDETPASAFFP